MSIKGNFYTILRKDSYAGKTLKRSSDQCILETTNEGRVFTVFTVPNLCIHVNELEATEPSVKKSLEQQMHLTLLFYTE